MSIVIVTLKIMPRDPDVNLDELYEEALKHIRDFVDEKHKDGEVKKEIESIAFGIKALKILFVMDEDVGGTDKLEEKVKQLDTVESVETTDVRRAVG